MLQAPELIPPGSRTAFKRHASMPSLGALPEVNEQGKFLRGWNQSVGWRTVDSRFLVDSRTTRSLF